MKINENENKWKCKKCNSINEMYTLCWCIGQGWRDVEKGMRGWGLWDEGIKRCIWKGVE